MEVIMEKQKPNKRKIQAAETKMKIHETAKKLFIEHGIEKVSVDSIVKAAGISKGAFYVHFESKDILASNIISDYVKEVDLEYKEYMNSIKEEVSSSDLLILMIGKIGEVIDNKLGCDNMKVLYKAHITKTIDTESSTSYNRDVYQIFTYIINRGINSGEFITGMTVEDLAHHFILAMRGITFEWCIRYPDFNLSEEFKKHFEILLNGIIKN